MKNKSCVFIWLFISYLGMGSSCILIIKKCLKLNIKKKQQMLYCLRFINLFTLKKNGDYI